jgi:hypothetical protein
MLTRRSIRRHARCRNCRRFACLGGECPCVRRQTFATARRLASQSDCGPCPVVPDLQGAKQS